jgi:hypothetical protein
MFEEEEERKMKKTALIILIGAFLFLCVTSSALYARVYIGGYFGFPYYPYPYGYAPYPYPYYYPHYYPPAYAYPGYPYAYAEPPVYSAPEQAYWYYCQDPQGYYPYVKSCPGGWMKVIPTPPKEREEGLVR